MLKSIGATMIVARFMVNDGVDTVSDIQQLTKDTVALFTKTCCKNLPAGQTVSTRFIIDPEKAAFKLTHLEKRVFRPIESADITQKWCRSMIEQMELEDSWDNEPDSELYPTLAMLKLNQTKWVDTLKNLLTMIRDTKGVPLAVVTRKHMIPHSSADDPAYGERYSGYASFDDEMIERAPIFDHDTYDHGACTKDLEKSGPFYPRHLAARNQVRKIIKRCVGANNKLSLQIKQWTKTTDGLAAYFAIETFLLENEHTTSMINAAEKTLATTTFQSNKRAGGLKIT